MPTDRPDYQCIRCGYHTRRKSDMRNHLYKMKKECQATKNNVELTDTIKECIINNRLVLNKERPTFEFDLEIPKDDKSFISIVPQRRTQIPKRIKNLVWDTFVGPNVAQIKCFCCGFTIIRMSEFDCGHVISAAKGGKMEVSNLRPICHACNLSMGTRSMTEFKQTHKLGERHAKC